MPPGWPPLPVATSRAVLIAGPYQGAVWVWLVELHGWDHRHHAIRCQPLQSATELNQQLSWNHVVGMATWAPQQGVVPRQCTHVALLTGVMMQHAVSALWVLCPHRGGGLQRSGDQPASVPHCSMHQFSPPSSCQILAFVCY